MNSIDFNRPDEAEAIRKLKRAQLHQENLIVWRESFIATVGKRHFIKPMPKYVARAPWGQPA